MSENMDIVYDYYLELGYDKKDETFFRENASLVIEKLKQEVWEKKYKPMGIEKLRNSISYLINEDDFLPDSNPMDAVREFIDANIEQIYEKCLSETQSRRSTTGSTFESILELVLLLSGVPIESQVSLDLGYRTKKKVDILSPGRVAFDEGRDNACLISLKTTLRERVEESVSEGQTADINIYMAHLDKNLSFALVRNCAERRMKLVTTKTLHRAYLEKAEERIINIQRIKDATYKNIEEWNDEIDVLKKEVRERKEQGKRIKALENKIDSRKKSIKDANERIEEFENRKAIYEKDRQYVKMHMMTFETLIDICLDKKKIWKDNYTPDQKKKVAESYVELIKRNKDYPRILSEYARRITELHLDIKDSEAKKCLDSVAE